VSLRGLRLLMWLLQLWLPVLEHGQRLVGQE